jgi:hypothetical protein
MNKKITNAIIICLWSNECVRVKQTWLACTSYSCVDMRQVVRHYTQFWLRWRILSTSRNVIHLAALVRFRFIFTLKEASLEHDKCELRFESKTLTTFCLVFSGRALSTGLEIAIVILSRFRCLSLHKMPYSWIVNFTELCTSTRTTAVNKRYIHLCAFRDLFTETYSASDQEVCLNAEECYRRKGAEVSSRGKVPVFILLLVAVCVHWCCCVCFCFRSRSYPVPHRGERVKQGTVHAWNFNNCYIDCKALHFS